MPATDHVSTDYDRLGRVKSTTDQRGVVHTYVYDTAGRVSEDQATAPGGWGDVSHAIVDIVTAYDDLGRVAADSGDMNRY
jgi:YD repeat-containing protein